MSPVSTRYVPDFIHTRTSLEETKSEQDHLTLSSDI